MLQEASLFVVADQVLVEVLGRIRPADAAVVLQPVVGLPARSVPLPQAVREHARDDARVPALLAGRAEVGRQDDRSRQDDERERDVTQDDVVRAAQAAFDAAAAVADGDALVPSPEGALPVRELLLRLAVARSLLAHYVAAHLGSTACPLPEELARPLWELTAPDAAAWRRLGYYREPMPLPPHVSWRDRFLLEAGHEPHPVHS